MEFGAGAPWIVPAPRLGNRLHSFYEKVCCSGGRSLMLRTHKKCHTGAFTNPTMNPMMRRGSEKGYIAETLPKRRAAPGRQREERWSESVLLIYFRHDVDFRVSFVCTHRQHLPRVTTPFILLGRSCLLWSCLLYTSPSPRDA